MTSLGIRWLFTMWLKESVIYSFRLLNLKAMGFQVSNAKIIMAPLNHKS
jgi:hypothetical protein